MKILLVLPNANIHRLNIGPLCLSFREAPLTLTTLAALIPECLDANVRIVDESVQQIPLDDPFDLVGISCLTGTAHRGYELAAHFKKQGATVVLGGVHVTLRPGEARLHADCIVQGFAEKVWPELLHDFAAGKLKPCYLGESDQIVGLPVPRRDLQKKWGYMSPNTVFATRGCKKNCDFCTVSAVPFGWHTRPVGEVIDEIRQIPTKRFVFNDVSLTEDRDYAMELFSALAPLKKHWGGLATVSLADDMELLEVMHRSGCRYLLTGFETVSDSGLAGMGKAINRTVDYPAAMKAFHSFGLIIQGCFILGLDQDDRSIFDQTVEVVNELQIDIPRFAIYTPYPGTQAFKRLKREGRILHEYWPHYDTQHVVYRPLQISAQELDDGFRQVYRQAFKLPSILRRTLASGHFPIAFLGNLAYRLYIRRLQGETQRLYRNCSEKVGPCPM